MGVRRKRREGSDSVAVSWILAFVSMIRLYPALNSGYRDKANGWFSLTKFVDYCLILCRAGL